MGNMLSKGRNSWDFYEVSRGDESVWWVTTIARLEQLNSPLMAVLRCVHQWCLAVIIRLVRVDLFQLDQ